MKKILTILFILLSSLVFSQKEYFVDVEISNSNPSIDEQVQLLYKLKYKGNNGSFNLSGMQIRKPQMSNFDIVDEGGGMNMNMSFGFGSSGGMEIYQYKLILQPKKVGAFTIAPVEFHWNKHVYKSPKVTLTINKSTGGVSTNKSKQSQGVSKGDLFGKTIVSKTKIYQGEPITVSQKVYSKLNIADIKNYKLPSYSGFWSEEIDIGQLKIKQEMINNVKYNVLEFKKSILFPQKSGIIKIEPMTVECVVQTVKTRRPRDHFEQMMYGNSIRYYANSVHHAKSSTVKINVLHLPSKGKPANFSNMIGSFKLKAELTKSELEINDATNLKITISGSGNIKLIEELDFNFPPDLEVYDPKISNKVNVNASGVSGSKTFDYIIIPRNAGTYKIKAASFSYFDVNQKKYKILSTPEYIIKVGKGDGSASNVVSTSINQEDIKYIGSDIRFIKNQAFKLKPKGTFFFGSILFFILLISPAILFILFIIIWRKQLQRRSNIALMKNKKATRVAKKRLKAANNFLKQNKRNEFFEEISQALWGYIGDKFTIQLSELSMDTVEETLTEKNVKQELIKQFIETLNNCEFARFAPGDKADTMEQIYKEGIETISKIESELR